MRTFEYRLYVNKEQSHSLMLCLAESRSIYNCMLEAVKTHYEEVGTFPSKFDLEAAFKGRGEHVPASTVQMLADRLTKSLKRFLDAKKKTFQELASPASRHQTAGIPSNSDNMAKIAIYMKIKGIWLSQRSWGVSLKSSYIDR